MELELLRQADPEVAEADACGMEHSISDESFEHFRRWYSALDSH